MPYHHVEGFQHGRPSAPLYVHADSDESAMARARELGMVVTGVRGAKEPEVMSDSKGISLDFLQAFLPVLLVYFHWYLDPKSQIWPALGVIFILFAGSVLRAHAMIRLQGKTIEMLQTQVKNQRRCDEQQKSAQPAPLE